MTRVITSHSEAATAAAGRDLAARLRRGTVVLVSGELGAGKTAFVRGLAEGLGIDTTGVSSPTFTLMQEYRGGRLTLLHVDLYRLRRDEVDDLGLDELTAGDVATAVEWPDRLSGSFDDTITVDIRHGDGDTRTISVRAEP